VSCARRQVRLLDQALAVAHEWLRRAQELRELSTRIEWADSIYA
jgi:hypothetical protein